MTESTTPIVPPELRQTVESPKNDIPLSPEKTSFTDTAFEINLDDDPRTVLESLANASPTEITDLDESQYTIEPGDDIPPDMSSETIHVDMTDTETIQEEHPQTPSPEQQPTITFDQAQQKVVDEAINRLRTINRDRTLNNQPPLSDYEVMWGINDALGKFQKAYQERFNDPSASVTTITELTEDIKSKMNIPTEQPASESSSQPYSRETSHSNSGQENYPRENTNTRFIYDNLFPTSGEYPQHVTETYIYPQRKVGEKPMTILDILILKMNKRLQKMNARIKHYKDRLSTLFSNINRPPENPPTPA